MPQRDVFCVKKTCGRRSGGFLSAPKTSAVWGTAGNMDLLRGKIRMKRAENGQIYVVKTMKLVDEEEAAEVRNRQEELKNKRREKRKQAKKSESAGK